MFCTWTVCTKDACFKRVVYSRHACFVHGWAHWAVCAKHAYYSASNVFKSCFLFRVDPEPDSPYCEEKTIFVKSLFRIIYVKS